MNIIEYLKQQTIIPQAKAETFIHVLGKYDENDILYENIIEQLDLSSEEYDELFTELERQDYVDPIYIIKCPYCDSLGNTYVEKFDIPDFDECRFCHEEFSHKENHINAFRVYFNYHKNIDILSELSEKIVYNQDRIFEITSEIKELELKRKAVQEENVKFVSLRNELLYDKNESKLFEKVKQLYSDRDVKYIGTLIYMKKCVVKCSKCGEIFELFDIDDKIIGLCPGCEIEIEFALK